MSIKLKIALSVVAIIVILLGFTISYFLFLDIESKVPKELKEECNVETENFMGRKIFIIRPKNKEISQKKILYFHGGSYMAEMSSNHWEFVKNLSIDTNMTIIIPDYPLTPKYTYKDVFKMVKPLYKEILEEVEAKDLILMGDSAGGGLSLALLETMAQENYSLPGKTILISPWLDVRLENPEIDEIQKKDKELNKEALKVAGIAYAGGEENTSNYLVSPIEGELSNLKNITIYTGTNDILMPDMYKLQEKAKEVNVDIKINEYQEAGHIWLITKKGDKNIIEKGYEDLLNETIGDRKFLSQERILYEK